MGLAGSPSICVTSPPFTYTSWAQPTAQYGQIECATWSASEIRGLSVRECSERTDLPRPSRSPSCSCRTTGHEPSSFVSPTQAAYPSPARAKRIVLRSKLIVQVVDDAPQLRPFRPECVVHDGEPVLPLRRQREVDDATIVGGDRPSHEPGLLCALDELRDGALGQRELRDELGNGRRPVLAPCDLQEEEVLARREAGGARNVLALAQELPQRRTELRSEPVAVRRGHRTFLHVHRLGIKSVHAL